MDMGKYIHFVGHALLGYDPNANDKFLTDNKKEIEEVASFMLERYPIKEGIIYRGLLLVERDIKDSTLEPLEHIKYLSFTEDKEVALDFADTSSEISQFFMKKEPLAKGYLVEQFLKKEEVLFHYSWADSLGLYMLLGEDSRTLIEKQKEVMLKQQMKKLKVRRT